MQGGRGHSPLRGRERTLVRGQQEPDVAAALGTRAAVGQLLVCQRPRARSGPPPDPEGRAAASVRAPPSLRRSLSGGHSGHLQRARPCSRPWAENEKQRQGCAHPGALMQEAPAMSKQDTGWAKESTAKPKRTFWPAQH